MKRYLKYFLIFLLVLFLWSLSGLLFNYNDAFYELLKKPSFVLNKNLIGIFWAIIYVLISISITIVISKKNILKEMDYLYILLTNYLSNQLFMYFFFYLMSPFLAFIVTTITFISSIFVYIETKKISKKASYLLIPYIIYSAYAELQILFIYFMNF